MDRLNGLTSFTLTLLLALALPRAPLAQGAPGAGQIPVDSWPRTVAAGGDTLTVYAPQVESWRANMVEARAALGVVTPALPKPTYGVVHYPARTEVDKAAGMVTPYDFHVTRAQFPTQQFQTQRFIATLG